MHAHSIERGDARAFVAYEKAAESDELVIPENLAELSDDDLSALSGKAMDAFQAIYDAGEADGFSDDGLTQLSSLTEALEALGAETEKRETARAERAEKAAELAAKVAPKKKDDAPADSGDDSGDDQGDDSGDSSGDDSSDGEDDDKKKEDSAAAEVGEEMAAEDTPSEVVASAQKRHTTRVNLAGVNRRRQSLAAAQKRSEKKHSAATAATDVPGFSQGFEMSLVDLGQAVSNRLRGINTAAFDAAASAGRPMRMSYPIANIQKDYRGLMSDGTNDDAVMDKATDEAALEGGSLVASGGWCAPSETIYDLFDDGAARDGLFTLPEIGVTRGGLRFTKGPDYSSVFSEGIGFHYTEQNDIAGHYAVDANGDGTGAAGTKPCYKVECTTFEEKRLEVDGLCISAGLLQSRGYPEVIARTIELALIAHDHRMSARKISEVVAGSTAITMPTPQVGTTAPLLTAIELQASHYRSLHRMAAATSLEAVFPNWIQGAVRSDLSRRLGVDFMAVTDQMIQGWFTSRGIAPQFVSDWQALSDTAATAFTAWPATVKFLLYRAGTWVAGGEPLISLSNVYDTTGLSTNDYTALFTEESYLVAKRGYDSRVVTVPVASTGETGAGVLIAHDGTAVPEAPAAG